MVVYYPQMNTQRASKALPIILAAITLATALFFWKQRDVLRQKTQELLNKSTKQASIKSTELTPTPTVSPTVTPTPTPIPTQISTKAVSSAKTTTTTICTPVYGMANTCAEHTVVDTALDTSIFYNLAGLSYFAGLASFIRAKKRA